MYPVSTVSATFLLIIPLDHSISTTDGQGGVPAFIGFNAGNGTRSYEYMPYSQAITKITMYYTVGRPLSRDIF